MSTSSWCFPACGRAWNGRSWQAGELQSALQFESKKVRIEEIRLLKDALIKTL